MNQYNSYYLYQQYEKRGSQDWLPCYPNIFSVDGDGTMPLVMKKENDPDCGYTGDTQPIYRWYPLPISTDYICDECPVVQYRWHNMDVSTDYYCDTTTYTKYYKQIRQYSYDSGTTWYDVTPPEYQQGSVYEQQSTDCGYVPPIEPQYRTTSGTPYCEGVDKYMDIYSQVSYDGGITWSTTATTPTLIEAQSVDCGYIPPGNKFVAMYNNDTSYSAVCDSDTTLTTGNTRPDGYRFSAMTSAEIGDCVTTIGADTFAYCENLTSVTIPNSVTYIGGSAFTYCTSLTSIDIPSGVTSIWFGAFRGCTGLTSIDIPSHTTTIGRYAFSGCTHLTSIDIPNSVTTLGYSAFTYCTRLTSCTIGSGITNITASAFRECTSLTSITIPNSVTSIGNYAFRNCRKLTSITIPNSVTSIGAQAFNYCTGLTSIYIPDSVTSIGDYAFHQCSGITTCTIGSGVTSIGSNVFEYCSGITTCTIGSSVTSIGEFTFYGCKSLVSITIEAITPPTLGSSVFGNTNDCPIYVPSGSVNTYKSDSYWSTYSSRIQAIP